MWWRISFPLRALRKVFRAGAESIHVQGAPMNSEGAEKLARELLDELFVDLPLDAQGRNLYDAYREEKDKREPIVAKALAACALEEAKWWAGRMRQMHLAAHEGQACRYCDRLAALERAAGAAKSEHNGVSPIK
jgi:hypothetical protein